MGFGRRFLIVPWVMQWFEKKSGIGLDRGRHFLDQKKVAKEGVPQCFLFISLLRSDRRSGLHFLCREKVTKSGRGARAEGLLRKARPFGAGRPSRGDQSPHVPPCPPGGISISAARRAKEIVRLRGLPRPRSIFGHFLLIKKVATSASGFCLTISQITNIPHGTT